MNSSRDSGQDSRATRSSTEKTSVLLRRLFDEITNDNILVEDIVRKLRRRSFGGISIVLAALSLVPGISLFTGLALLVLGVQIACGLRGPLLPRFITQRRIDTAVLVKIGTRFVDRIENFERFVKPRWFLLTTPPLSNALGLLIAVLALVVMMPLPFSNMPPAIALLLISVGLLERDGLLIAVGIAVSMAALLIGFLVAGIAYESMVFFMTEE